MLGNEEHRDYWLQSAEADMETMQILFANSQYLWALFVGHLVIEKMLKAVYAHNSGNSIPRMHDLSRLAELAGLELSEARKEELDNLSTFNISARYPDYKNRLFQVCTQEYTKQQITIIKDLYKWLLTLLIQN